MNDIKRGGVHVHICVICLCVDVPLSKVWWAVL